MGLANDLRDSTLGMEVQMRTAAMKSFAATLLFIFISCFTGTALMLKALFNRGNLQVNEQVFLFTIGLLSWSLCIYMASYYITLMEQISSWSRKVQDLLMAIFTTIDEAFDGTGNSKTDK